jgi:hypothetical protein
MAGLCGLYLLPGIKLVIDNEDFVAKKLVNIGNDDVDIEDAAHLLMGDLIRLKRIAYFSKGFIVRSARVGVEVTGISLCHQTNNMY